MKLQVAVGGELDGPCLSAGRVIGAWSAVCRGGEKSLRPLCPGGEKSLRFGLHNVPFSTLYIYTSKTPDGVVQPKVFAKPRLSVT